MLALGLTACGATAGAAAPSTITMGASNFVGATSLTMTARQSVTFKDPSISRGIHILVTGTKGKYTVETDAPDAFNTSNGTTFNPGMTQSYSFSTPGTYTITVMAS